MASTSSTTTSIALPPAAAATTRLVPQGYGIELARLPPATAAELRSELTARPFKPKGYGPQGAAPLEFPLFHEEGGYIYAPKAFGLERFGRPASDLVSDGEPITAEFAGSLRPEQREPSESWLRAARDPARRGGVLNLPCAFGKCLARGTPVVMADGTLRAAEDVRVGDRLISDDGTARAVVGVCMGVEDMVRVVPQDGYGAAYTVNAPHLLTLWDAAKAQLVDVPAGEVLASVRSQRAGPDGLRRLSTMLGVRMAVREFPDAPAGGTAEEAAAEGALAAREGGALPVYAGTEARRAVVLGALRELGAASAAPLGDAAAGRSGVWATSRATSQSLVFLLRSLGLLARAAGGGAVTWAPPGMPAAWPGAGADAALHAVAVEAQPAAHYYGFTLEAGSTGRFLLGDCTLTHNTAIAINLVCAMKRRALVVVHKEFLVQQWRERLAQFAPTARVGLLQGDKVDVRGKDVVIAMLQSLAMRDYPPEVLAGFGTVVVDEIHRTGAEVFSRALQRVNFRYALGLSATLQRKDGMSKVFLYHIGGVVFRAERREDEAAAAGSADKAPRVRMLKFSDPDPAYCREHLLPSGKTNLSRMINNVCDFAPRTARIADEVATVLAAEPARRVLVLSDRRAHLAAIEAALHARGWSDVGYYLGGMRQADLKASESRAVILGTFAMSAEGLDIRGLDTLVLASPKTDVVQAVGRVLRDKPCERRHAPLILDIVDQFSPFAGQAARRAKFYASCGYAVGGDAGKTARKAAREEAARAKEAETGGRCLFMGAAEE